MRWLRILLVAVLGLTASFGQYDPAPRLMGGTSGGSSLGTVAQLGLANAVYLAMRTDSVAGTGAQWDPYDVSTPAKWSSVWFNHNFANTVVVCIPNSSANPYLIEGNGDGTSNNTWQIPQSCIVVINGCYFKLNSLTNATPTMFGNVYNADGAGAGVIGYGATLDGNATALSASTSNSINAIKLYGNKCFMLGVKAINMYGNTGGSEGFTFTFATYTDGGGEHDVSGNYGADLTEDSFQGNYGGTFLTFTTSGSKSCQAIWSHCSVYNKLGASSNFSTCAFGGTGVGPVTQIAGYAENVSTMFYYEGPIANYKAIGCVGKNLRNAGVSLNGQGGNTYSNMEWDDCDFEVNDADLSGGTIKHGVHITSPSSGNITNIIFTNLKLRERDVVGTTTPTSFNIANASNLIFNDVMIDSALGAPTFSGCVPQFNNATDFTGNPVAKLGGGNYLRGPLKADLLAFSALPACTYANGTSGVGATLTGNSNGALGTVNGTATTQGMAILVTGQASTFQNGLYVLIQTGDGSHPFILMRHTQYDTSDKIIAQKIYALAGTVNGKQEFVCGATSPITIGTDALVFVAPISVNTSGSVTISPASGQNANINGVFVFGGNGAFNDATQSTSTGSGCATFAGGLGIAKDVFLGGRINLASKAATTTNGDLWNDSTQTTLLFRETGATVSTTRTLFTQTADVTVANSGAGTTLVGTGIGTATIPASFLVAGKTIRVHARGIIANTGTPTLRFQLKLGTTVMADTSAQTMVSITGTKDWEASFDLTLRTTGGSATSKTVGACSYFSAATTNNPLDAPDQAATFNSANSQTVGLFVTWGTASASNTITCTNLTIEVLN